MTARRASLFGVLAACLVVGACVAGSPEASHAAAGGGLSQFLLGLWHGVIAPLMLVVEVVNRLAPRALPWTVRFYEAKGATVVYDVGFYLGLVGSPLLIGSRWRGRGG